jgi:homeobox protein HB9
MPGPSSVGGCTPPDPPRRQRSVYTSSQIAQLEAYFNINEYIDGERKRQLSLMTKIPEQQIKVWFQNRRQKKKREQEEQLQQQLAASRGPAGNFDMHPPPRLSDPGGGGGLKIKMERRHDGNGGD